MTDAETEAQILWMLTHYPETVRWIRFCARLQLVVAAMVLSGCWIRQSWFWILTIVVGVCYVAIEAGVRFVADLQLDDYRKEQERNHY